jgi:hypothetical protein
VSAEEIPAPLSIPDPCMEWTQAADSLIPDDAGSEQFKTYVAGHMFASRRLRRHFESIIDSYPEIFHFAE